MRRLLAILAVTASCASVGLAGGAIVPSIAMATQTDAQNLAQNHVQNPGCGDGTSWGCQDRYWVPQSCSWYAGGPFWACNGVTEETHWDPFPSWGVWCNWKVHIHNSAVLYWHDYCRDRTGSGWLG